MVDPKVVERVRELARAAVADIVADLTDRSGFPEDFDTGSDWAEARAKMTERIEWALMRAIELREGKS